MTARWTWLIGAVGCLAWPACTMLAGLDDLSFSSTASTSTHGGGSGGDGGEPGGGGTGGAGVCQSPALCVPSLAGWSGPYAVVSSSSDPAESCTGAFAEEELLLHDDLTADPAVCECRCDASAVSCGDATTAGYTTACTGLPCTSMQTLENTCFDPPTGCAATHFLTTADATGSCTEALDETMPPISWGVSHRVCSSTQPLPTCTGGHCVEPVGAPFASFACVVAAGDLSCPSEFPNKSLGYVAVADNRACTGSCSCMSPRCGSISYYGATNCTGGNTNTSVPGFCVQMVPGSAYYTPGPSCATGGSASPTGNVSPTEPHTICCL